MPDPFDNMQPHVITPMTDAEGEEYARQETLDGRYPTTDTRD